MTTSPEEFITNLVRADNGLLRASTQSGFSYPEDGHDICANIEDKSFWFGHRNAAISSVISSYPPPAGKPFLDIGGGNGYVAMAIQALGHRVVVIEPGENGARVASERGIAEVVQSSIVDLDVVDDSVGAIGMFDVLEHIEDDVAALQKLKQSLVPGGRLYLTVPAHRWLWTSVDVGSGHYRRYTRSSLRKVLRAAGFEISFLSYYFWPLPAPMFLLRVLPERLKLRKGETKAQRVSREHEQSSGLMARALTWERGRLGTGRGVPFGASCIAVATRTS